MRLAWGFLVKFKLEQDYRELRRAEYPPIAEQLDALWKGGAEAEQMKAKVLAVKERFPKSHDGK